MLKDQVFKVTAALNQASYAANHVERATAAYRSVRAWHTNRTTWRVTFPMGSELATWLEPWLQERIVLNEHPNNQRLMAAKLMTDKVSVFFADSAEHKFTVNGHEVVFSIGDPNERTTPGAMPDIATEIVNVMAKQVQKKDYIFTVRSLESRDALIEAINSYIVERRNKFNPNWLRFYTGYGDWERSKELSSRKPSSLVLGDGQYERIVTDVKRFIGEKERYAALGIPYHRGYLFYGPPGTGKTSLAHVLAGDIGRDLYTLSLNSIDKDSKLLDAVHTVSRDALLLIEDVDIFSASVTREGGNDNVTLHGLLQVLDGLDTPDGLIVILTTNHKDRLDPALTRPGRVDLAEEIGLPEYAQVARLFKEVYGESMTRRLPAGAWSPTQTMSTYMEVFKRHLDDIEAAIAGLIAVETVVTTDDIKKAANEKVETNASHNV